MSEQDDLTLAGLADDFAQRSARGEAPTVEAYARAHPHLAERIRRLFPVLGAMEGLGRSQPERAPAAPTVLGPYRLLAERGRGGMGRVYEAQALEGAAVAPGTRVAVKVVHAHLAQEPALVERFLREAEVGRRVRHANLVGTLDAGVADSPQGRAPWIALEWIEGSSLRRLLDEVGPLSERLARHVGGCVAAALGALHAAGVLHRDVKPENVVLTPTEEIRLIDYGVAAMPEDDARLTRPGQFVGSMLYAAPEQLAGTALTPAADLYALGLLLYEALTGEPPAQALSGFATARDPGALPFPPDTTPFLAVLVRSLLEPDPARRVGDAARVAGTLAQGERSTWWQEHAAEHVLALPVERRTRLVGRAHELAVLSERLERARLGRGSVVVVTGEPGIGKSRLVLEWAGRSAAGLARPLVVRHHGLGGPSSGAAALTEALAERLAEEPDLPGFLERALERLPGLGPAFQRVLAGDDGALEPGASAAAHVAATLALGAGRPLIVVAEDAHLATRRESDLLASLARAATTRSLLLVVTSRPPAPGSATEALTRLPDAAHLALPGLPAEHARLLLADALGGSTGGAALEALVRRSDGNPLVLLHWADDRRQARRSADAPIPGTIRELVENRLAALSPPERELLDLAAVAGYTFDPLLVAEAAGIGTVSALQRVHLLDRQRGLLRSEGDLYRFVHHVVRDTVEEALPPALREAAHGALGEALARRTPAGAATGAQAVALAHHLLASARPERAAPWLASALESCLNRDDYERLGALLARVGGAAGLPRLLEGRDLVRALIVACVHDALRDGSIAVEARLLDTVARADALGDDALRLQARKALGVRRRFRGDVAGALAVHEQAESIVRASGDRLEHARVTTDLIACLHQLGRAPEAVERGRAALEVIRAAGDRTWDITCSNNLAQALLRSGAGREARALLDHALALALPLDLPEHEVALRLNLAYLAHAAARIEDAAAHAERGLTLARELSDVHRQAAALSGLVRVRLAQGRLAEALAAATEARPISDGFGSAPARAQAGLSLAQALEAAGRLDEALVQADAALALVQATSFATVHTAAHRVRASVLVRLGRPAEAREALGRARALPSTSLNPYDLSLLALTEADALLALGDAAGSRLAAESGLSVARPEEWDRERGSLLLARARARLAQGEEASAQADLLEARSFGERSGLPGVVLLARVLRAEADRDERLPARVALEAGADHLPRLERIEARLRLGARLVDSALTAAAEADLRGLLEGLAPEARLPTERALRQRTAVGGAPSRA